MILEHARSTRSREDAGQELLPRFGLIDEANLPDCSRSPSPLKGSGQGRDRREEILVRYRRTTGSGRSSSRQRSPPWIGRFVWRARSTGRCRMAVAAWVRPKRKCTTVI